MISIEDDSNRKKLKQAISHYSTLVCWLSKFSYPDSSDLFYIKNKALIDNFAGDERVCVVDFDGNQTELRYSKAKIIDMIGFIGGREILEKRKKEKQAEKEAAEAKGRTVR